MTPDEIKNHKPLGKVEASGEITFVNEAELWLREIAYQLAVLNEQTAKMDNRTLSELYGGTHGPQES